MFNFQAHFRFMNLWKLLFYPDLDLYKSIWFFKRHFWDSVQIFVHMKHIFPIFKGIFKVFMFMFWFSVRETFLTFDSVCVDTKKTSVYHLQSLSVKINMSGDERGLSKNCKVIILISVIRFFARLLIIKILIFRLITCVI